MSADLPYVETVSLTVLSYSAEGSSLFHLLSSKPLESYLTPLLHPPVTPSANPGGFAVMLSENPSMGMKLTRADNGNVQKEEGACNRVARRLQVFASGYDGASLLGFLRCVVVSLHTLT